MHFRDLEVHDCNRESVEILEKLAEKVGPRQVLIPEIIRVVFSLFSNSVCFRKSKGPNRNYFLKQADFMIENRLFPSLLR